MTSGVMRRLPNARDLAKQILDGQQPMVDLYAYLAAIMQASDPSLSELEALEAAEERVAALAHAVDAAIDASRRGGLTPAYEWQGGPESGVLVHVSEIPCAADGRPSPAAVIARRRELRRGLLQRDFGDQRFERVCEYLLQVYGARAADTGVTRPTGDGGIDFYGIYEPGAESGARRLATQPYRIAGQAKRWKHSVDKAAIELFTGRLARWRLGTGDRWQDLPEWFRISNLPILGLFITTSEYAEPGLRVAAENLCVCLDGETICEDLAQAASADCWFATPDGTLDLSAFAAQFDR